MAMCRSIKRLRGPDGPATEDEIRAAALQFVRKVSGFQRPTSRNEAAFLGAVDEVALAAQRLLDQLPPLRPAVTGPDGPRGTG
jgi:hypothetical protein